jgi:hypothetical protein
LLAVVAVVAVAALMVLLEAVVAPEAVVAVESGSALVLPVELVDSLQRALGRRVLYQLLEVAVMELLLVVVAAALEELAEDMGLMAQMEIHSPAGLDQSLLGVPVALLVAAHQETQTLHGLLLEPDLSH